MNLDRLYDAVVAPELWPEALHDLARSVNAVGCFFAPHDPKETIIAPPVSTDAKAPLEDFVVSGWCRRDHRATRGWPLVKAGCRVILEHDLASDEERKHGAYYNEWLRPWDLPWWAGIGFTVEGRLWCLPFLRSSSQGPFSREEAQRLAALAPHLARVVGMAEKLSIHRAKAVLDVLDRITCAALTIDWRGKVVQLNAKAERLIVSDLDLRHGRLRARDLQSDKGLQRLITAALSPRFPAIAAEEAPVVITRFGKRPLIVRALPTVGLLSDIFLYTRSLLLISDLEEPSFAAEQTIRAAFRLTPAEARLAARLATGEALEQAADALGISKGTARVHLRSIFAKTDTHRQAELVALMVRLSRAVLARTAAE